MCHFHYQPTALTQLSHKTRCCVTSIINQLHLHNFHTKHAVVSLPLSTNCTYTTFTQNTLLCHFHYQPTALTRLSHKTRCCVTSIINQLHLLNFHTKHAVVSLPLSTNCTYITFTQNTFKHLKSLRHVSVFSDHHQGAFLFLAKVILQYSQFPHYVAYGAHLANCSLYLTFLHNLTSCHNSLFA